MFRLFDLSRAETNTSQPVKCLHVSKSAWKIRHVYWPEASFGVGSSAIRTPLIQLAFARTSFPSRRVVRENDVATDA